MLKAPEAYAAELIAAYDTREAAMYSFALHLTYDDTAIANMPRQWKRDVVHALAVAPRQK
jgi:hypothetical protein